MKIMCSHTRLVPITELKLTAKNPNAHPDKQIKMLAKIIKHQGWRHPVVVSNQTGLVRAGHGRIMAAMLNEWQQVPVDFQDFDSVEDELAYLVSDNKIQELSEADDDLIQQIALDIGPDFDFDLFGIDDFQIKGIDTLPPDESEDNVPQTPVEATAKLGQIYKLGNHRLMCGDFSVNGDFFPECDLLYTDPPYGIDIHKRGSFMDGKQHGKALAAHGKYTAVKGDENLDCVQFLVGTLNRFKHQVIWGANNFPQFLTPSNTWLVWDKEQHANHGDCELAYCNSDKAIRMFTHKWVGFNKASERGEPRVHPTQKPVALAEWAIGLFKDEVKTVADPFGGSGSTLIACEKTNRTCYMMELEPKYIDVILKRWSTYTGKEPELIKDV